MNVMAPVQQKRVRTQEWKASGVVPLHIQGAARAPLRRPVVHVSKPHTVAFQEMKTVRSPEPKKLSIRAVDSYAG